MNTYFNSNVIWLQLEYKMPTLVECTLIFLIAEEEEINKEG